MSHDFVRNYRNIKVEPNSYKLELGIPTQPSLSSVYTKVDVLTEVKLEEMMFELCERLPENIMEAINDIDGNPDFYVYDDERLSFIEIPDPVKEVGRLTNANLMVSGYRTYLAQMLYCLENGATLDEFRILHAPRSDMEFAIDLQFLQDNGIDIDSLDQKAQVVTIDYVVVE